MYVAASDVHHREGLNTILSKTRSILRQGAGPRKNGPGGDRSGSGRFEYKVNKERVGFERGRGIKEKGPGGAIPGSGRVEYKLNKERVGGSDTHRRAHASAEELVCGRVRERKSVCCGVCGKERVRDNAGVRVSVGVGVGAGTCGVGWMGTGAAEERCGTETL